MNGITLLAAVLVAGSGFLGYTGMANQQLADGGWQTDPDVGLPAVYEEYHAEFGGCNELMYVNCTFKGELTEEQLAELNPLLVYNGTSAGMTYAVLFSEEPSQELYDKGGAALQAYYDKMNELIGAGTAA